MANNKSFFEQNYEFWNFWDFDQCCISSCELCSRSFYFQKSLKQVNQITSISSGQRWLSVYCVSGRNSFDSSHYSEPYEKLGHFGYIWYQAPVETGSSYFLPLSSFSDHSFHCPIFSSEFWHISALISVWKNHTNLWFDSSKDSLLRILTANSVLASCKLVLVVLLPIPKGTENLVHFIPWIADVSVVISSLEPLTTI